MFVRQVETIINTESGDKKAQEADIKAKEAASKKNKTQEVEEKIG
jgi:hypothetical protein